jgi:transcriptional regulator with XRE-family HTH domain
MAKRTSAPRDPGARLSAAREAANLSQTALAKRLGCSKSSVSLWERGKRSPDREHSWKLFELLKLPPMSWV